MSYNRWLSGTELYHHGIKDQKWGVRNGPPYPLSRQQGHRDGAKKETSSGRSSGTEKASSGRRSGGSDVTTGRHLEESPSIGYAHDREWIEVEERTFPDGRKIYPSPAIVIRDFENAGMDNPYSLGVDPDNIYHPEVGANPGYGEDGTTNNCVFCGCATELRKRGYDVVARRSNGGASAAIFERWFKGASTTRCDTWQEMVDELYTFDNGAHGVLQGFYGEGLGSGMGGHTVWWWKNYDGRVVIHDGQTGTYVPISTADRAYGFGKGGCTYTRLDECDPDWDNIAEDGAIGVNNSNRRYLNKNTGRVVGRW